MVNGQREMVDERRGTGVYRKTIFLLDRAGRGGYDGCSCLT